MDGNSKQCNFDCYKIPELVEIDESVKIKPLEKKSKSKTISTHTHTHIFINIIFIHVKLFKFITLFY